MRRVGVNVVDKKLDIGSEKNVWLQHELDLDDLISKDEKGLLSDRSHFWGRGYALRRPCGSGRGPPTTQTVPRD